MPFQLELRHYPSKEKVGIMHLSPSEAKELIKECELWLEGIKKRAKAEA